MNKDIINYSPFIEFCFFALIIILFAICLSLCISRMIHSKKINPEKLSMECRWVNRIIRRYSIKATRLEYAINGKSIKLENGRYSGLFITDADKCFKHLCYAISDNGVISENFKTYVSVCFPLARRDDLITIILSYCYYLHNYVTSYSSTFVPENDLSPYSFFELKRSQTGDVVGIYIIYNHSKNKPYVGQAKKLFFRVNQHFTGHGNGDIYADYKYGDVFSIKLIPLSRSGYDDLDLLERTYIEYYNASSIGYNKTVGNS